MPYVAPDRRDPLLPWCPSADGPGELNFGLRRRAQVEALLPELSRPLGKRYAPAWERSAA